MEELETNSQGVSPEAEPATPDASLADAEIADAAVAEEGAADPEITDEGAAVDTDGATEVDADEGAVDPDIAELAADEAPADDSAAEPSISVDELMGSNEVPVDEAPEAVSQEDAHLKAILEAIVYVAEEPLTLAQIAASLQQPTERVKVLLDELIADFDQPGHGVSVREVAGGYKMATKPEHHEAVRNFVKSLKPPLKLSLPALETLAVIAYKQPATGPEIMEIRGVQGGGVFKTLLDRKLIAVAGRKNVIGKPILYKTTKEFLIQFGLKDLSELPSLKEFEEIRRMAFADSEPPAAAAQEPVEIIEEVSEEEVAEIVDATAEVEAEAVEPAPAEATEEAIVEPVASAPAEEATAETPQPATEEPAAEPASKEEE